MDMLILQPDIDFIRQTKKISGSSVKECVQCGECAAICSLSPEYKPFPRKELIWAGWGLKNKLMGNLDIWLCHQCGDCSAHCPRGINPADVLAALRQMNYLHYAKPKFLAYILGKPALLPLALAIPFVIILAIIYAAGTLRIPEGPVIYSKFFPHAWLNSSFFAITLVIIGLTVSGIRKFWNDLKKNFPQTRQTGIFKSFLAVINEIIFHKNFNRCNTQRSRRISHLMVFYGFILLLVVTVCAIIAVITGNYPLPFLSPVKILGNIAALLLLTGLSIMIYQRLFNRKIYGNSNYSDWLFLVTLLLLTISGVILEIARFENWHSAYHFYFLHLLCVWFIVFYVPYIKFGHFVYRTVALVYARSRGRVTFISLPS
jgi:quinone-modifying oxidoreductase subunit QmoC